MKEYLAYTSCQVSSTEPSSEFCSKRAIEKGKLKVIFKTHEEHLIKFFSSPRAVKEFGSRRVVKEFGSRRAV